jgi:tRNA threonylcarbamoyladenosine biosynthesis protein TsaB
MGIALVRGDHVLAERADEGGRIHSESLLPGIDALLAETGLSLDEVDAFALSIGPGSFTGLRIGLATVKGFALASDRDVIAVPTLAGLAAAVPDAAPAAASGVSVAALLDARRGEVYAAGYAAPGEVDPVRLAEGVYTPADLAAQLPRASVLAVGEGAEEAAERVLDLRPDVTRVAAPARAGRIGCIAAAASLPRTAAAALVPRYVRRAEAEVKRTGERTE